MNDKLQPHSTAIALNAVSETQTHLHGVVSDLEHISMLLASVKVGAERAVAAANQLRCADQRMTDTRLLAHFSCLCDKVRLIGAAVQHGVNSMSQTVALVLNDLDLDDPHDYAGMGWIGKDGQP